MKAFAIVTTMISPNYSHRVQLRRKLHEFKLPKGGNVMDRFLRFDDLCMSMQATGQVISSDEQLVILLGSLSDDYDQIVTIAEYLQELNLFQVKEMVQREYDGMMRRESNEISLRLTQVPKSHGFHHKNKKGKFFENIGHKRQDCRNGQDKKTRPDELAFTVSNQRSEGWLLDSGASSHMCPRKNEFAELEILKNPIKITVTNGSEVLDMGIGTVRVMLKIEKTIKIEGVLFFLDLDRRLLSIPALSRKGLQVLFTKTHCEIRMKDELVTRVTKFGKIYIMEYTTVESARSGQVMEQVPKSVDIDIWQARLGHLPMSKMKTLEECVNGFKIQKQDIINRDEDELCEGCMVSKTSVKPFPKSKHGQVKTEKPLQAIHSDVMGPVEKKSQGGQDLSYTVAYFLTHKSEVVDRFMDFKALMGNQLECKIKCIRTDNGTGIVHQTTIPYSPQQNGLAERMNRTITERGKGMLFHMNVDKRWWAEAMNTAVFITNRLSCASYPKKNPFELLFGQKKRIFQECAYLVQKDIHISTSIRESGWTRRRSSYAYNVKGYCVWNIDLGRVMFTRSVTFDESPHSKYIQVRMDNVEKNHQRYYDDDDCEITPGYNTDIQEDSDMEIDGVGRQQDYQGTSSQLTHSDIGTNRTDPLFEIDDIFMNEDIDAEDWTSSQALVRKRHDEPIQDSRSIIQHPTSSSSFSNAIVPVQDLSNKFTTEEKGGVSKRLRIGYEQACTAYEIPTSYADAFKSPQETMWRKAIQVELDALNEKDTWSVEQMKPNKKIIGTKWVFAFNRNERGEVERFKARLVALGYRQTYGIDYTDTYLPKVNMNSVRIFMAVCCQEGMFVHRCDIDTAFLNGILEEEVYIYTRQKE
ncbi:hypothetical protein PsorP6_013784 [Peronosclerospora sorghi]|uniref:Uncharacterized protein n=1 Tax=Peronosclerospora sorghi TaxID=230839 RepID=A0ACC0VJ41_9STRA|nr:hypothetical protein PsorP6_013784 [Peronosclerospora sorghi]